MTGGAVGRGLIRGDEWKTDQVWEQGSDVLLLLRLVACLLVSPDGQLIRLQLPQGWRANDA